MSQSQSLMSLIEQAGFSGQAAETMYAIVMAESGGNATAYNGNAGTGDNSYGLAQINMIGSMGPERLKEFGLKSNNDLYDPLTNLKVAYKLSDGGTNFSPWSTYNRGDYRQFLGQSNATVTYNSNGNTSSGSGADYTSSSGSTSQNTALGYENALGDIGDLINSIPELKQMLQKAMSTNEDVNSFVNDVENSNWWKANSQTVRGALALKANDPSTYRQNVTNAERHVSQMAASLGVSLTTAQIQQFALGTIYQNISDATLQGQIGAAYNGSNSGAKGGQSVTLQQQLTQLAASYGVPVTQAWTNKWIQTDLETGNGMEGAQADLQKQAESLYPVYAKDIAAGKTVADLASPYQATMANILEIDPNSISLTDPTIQKALQAKDASGAPTQVPLWQFQDQLRNDPRWQTTDNAKQSAYSMLHQLGADFGFAT